MAAHCRNYSGANGTNTTQLRGMVGTGFIFCSDVIVMENSQGVSHD
jgi:hypothetical protein